MSERLIKIVTGPGTLRMKQDDYGQMMIWTEQMAHLAPDDAQYVEIPVGKSTFVIHLKEPLHIV